MSKKTYTFSSEFNPEDHTMTHNFDEDLKVVTDFKNKSIVVANAKGVIIKTDYANECFTFSEYEILLMQAISANESMKEYNNRNSTYKQTAK